MRVERCAEGNSYLTIDQIRTEEGVYSSPDFCNPEKTRLIIIRRDSASDSYAAIYFDGYEILSSYSGWTTHRFVKTNENVCINIK